MLAQANAAVDQLEDEIFAGFDSREHSRLITPLQRAAKQADLPDSIHPDLRRRRRAHVLATGARHAWCATLWVLVAEYRASAPNQSDAWSRWFGHC